MSRARSRSPIGRRRSPARTERRFNPNSDRMVYITNLPYEMSWKELKDHIRLIGEVQFVEVLKTRDGKSKGCAVVEMTSKDMAQKCVNELNRKPLGGRTLSAKEIRDPGAFFRKIDEEQGISTHDRGSRGRPPSRGGHSSPYRSNETFGLSLNFLDSLDLRPPLVNRVFVTNISYNCGVGKLYDVFAMAGRITWIDLQLDKEGKTKGMAIIEYSHPIEAVQAVSMLHNRRLFDRSLSVKMDRFQKDLDRDRGGIPNGLSGVGMGLGANGAPLTDVSAILGQMQQQQQPIQLFQGLNPVAQAAPPAVQNAPVAAAYSAFQQAGPQQSVLQTPPTAGFDSQYFPQQQSSQQYSSTQAARPASPQSFYGHTAATIKPEVAYQDSAYSNAQYSQRAIGGSQQTNGYGSQNGVTAAATAQQQQRIASLYPTDLPTRIILIKNLPHDYTWDVIAQRLRTFGDFESVELVSSGVAKVRFLHVQDAERARNTLNNTLVESNHISVEEIMGSTFSRSSAATEEKPKLKPCCACPETKQARDECIVINGEEQCAEFIEAHKRCMREAGFNI